MSPPVRKAIRPSTSSPSRNKRRKPRKKARAAGLFLWGLQKRGRVDVARRERPFLDRIGALPISLRVHGQAKSMAGTGTAAGRAVERGGDPVPRRSGSLVDPVFGERRCRAARREGAEGEGGPGRARGGAKAGGAP